MVPNLVEVIQGSPKSHGCEATFVSINETWGLKYWYSQRKAEHTYRMNKHAAEFGLAPKVGEMIQFALPTGDEGESETYHGYFVEKIEMTYKDRYYGEDDSWWAEEEDEDGNTYLVIPRDRDNNIDFPEVDLPDLVEQLKEIGFSRVEDLHWENVGWMPDGRFVCIDFDYCRLEEINEEHESGSISL